MPPEEANNRRGSVRRKRRSDTDKTLEAFRRDTGGAKLRGNSARPPISVREKLITLGLGLALVLPPWLKGSMSPLAHWLTLGLAAFAFVMLWIPIGKPNLLNLNAPPSLARKTLFRFPLFWLGLLLLTYVLIAALNPRIEVSFLRSLELWNEIDFIPWLPAGIDAPFPLASSWKVLLQWGTIWLSVCALWAGCRRRRTVNFLFWLGALNAALVGLVGASHSFSGNRFYLWVGESMAEFGVYGPFLYDNHAASFLILGLGMASTLVLLHLGRAQFSRNGSHIFLGAVTLVVICTIFVTRSRGGIILGTICFGMLVLLVLIMFRKRDQSFNFGFIAGLLLFVAGTAALFTMVPWKRLGRDFNKVEPTKNKWDLGYREQTYLLTLDMWKDAPALGWGPGSFRYVFPKYQENSPILSARVNGKRPHWQHAHSDWLEELSDLGLVGYSFILAGFFWVYSRLFFWRKNLSASTLMAFGAGSLVFVHAGIDFVLQNPAVLLSLAFLIVGSLRLILSEREIGA